MLEPINIPDATSTPEAYVASLLAALGNRDPMDQLDRTVEEVRRLTEGLSSEELSECPCGEWSIAQNVGHLFDVDVCYGFRIRLILTETRPTYPAYDEKRLVALPKPQFGALVDAWEGLRRANTLLFRSMDTAQRRRTGLHPEQGEESAMRLAEKMAGHDLAHLNQIARTIQAVRSD
jgi:DinB superfamily